MFFFNQVDIFKEKWEKLMTQPNSNLPNLNAKIEEFITELENKEARPLYDLTPEKAREFLNELQCKNHKNIPAEVEDRTILTNSIGNVEIRIVRPVGNFEKLPVIIYAHGGGWILGGKETHDMLIRTIANKVNAVVIFPEYSLAPEYQYPTQLEEIYGVIKYINENPEEFNIDNEKMIIAGDSAGANMATVLAIKAQEDNLTPKIKFQCLFYPVTNLDMDTNSYKDFKNGPWLSQKAMEWFAKAYISEKEEKKSYYVSPLKADIEKLHGLPPTLIITDENDVLRDEGEAYARKLNMAGVEVICLRINGTIHDFVMLNALYDTIQTQSTIDFACQVMKKIISI